GRIHMDAVGAEQVYSFTRLLLVLQDTLLEGAEEVDVADSVLPCQLLKRVVVLEDSGVFRAGKVFIDHGGGEEDGADSGSLGGADHLRHFLTIGWKSHPISARPAGDGFAGREIVEGMPDVVYTDTDGYDFRFGANDVALETGGH